MGCRFQAGDSGLRHCVGPKRPTEAHRRIQLSMSVRLPRHPPSASADLGESEDFVHVGGDFFEPFGIAAADDVEEGVG